MSTKSRRSPTADQVSDLQPPPLRPHRRRQGVQGRRRAHHRAQEGEGASRSAGRSEHACCRTKSFDGKKTITLGGTTLELSYIGLNHSDSNIVMRLPKEKIIFVVDTIPVGSFPGRGMIDFYPLEAEAFIKKVMAMDWDRLIPGHPGQPAAGSARRRMRRTARAILQEASAEIKKLGQDGKCWDTVEKEFKMPKYATLPGYEAGLGMLARRYCGLWGRGT